MVQWVEQTNWRLLQCQKTALVSLVFDMDPADPKWGTFNGLVNFLDAVQDWAVESCGLPEEVVFNK